MELKGKIKKIAKLYKQSSKKTKILVGLIMLGKNDKENSQL